MVIEIEYKVGVLKRSYFIVCIVLDIIYWDVFFEFLEHCLVHGVVFYEVFYVGN